MKRADESRPAGAPLPHDGTPGRVSLRALYADAMQKVMADPRRAIAEHDPWLAALLPGRPPTSSER
jgi:hypothetical protein